MKMENVKQVLEKWAGAKPFISKIYIFGSRATKDFTDNSDLDVAIEFDPIRNDENSFTTWVCEAENWRRQLQTKLPYKLDLQHFDGDNTPTIKAGIENSSILVYERQKANHMMS